MEYESLDDFCIDWSKFKYSDYYKSEQDLIKPVLQNSGFTHVQFSMGEYDSFGPLTRVVIAKDNNGRVHKFVYG